MPRTDATGSGSLLPTPTATERATVGAGEPFVTSTGTVRRRNADGTSSNLGLLHTARLWPTPDASMGTGGRCTKPDQVSPTGRMKDGRKRQISLNDAVRRMWSTPTAQDAKNATLPASQATRDSIPGDLIRSGETGALNPEWVEWLMGYPPGFTSPTSPEPLPTSPLDVTD